MARNKKSISTGKNKKSVKKSSSKKNTDKKKSSLKPARKISPYNLFQKEISLFVHDENIQYSSKYGACRGCYSKYVSDVWKRVKDEYYIPTNDKYERNEILRETTSIILKPIVVSDCVHKLSPDEFSAKYDNCDWWDLYDEIFMNIYLNKDLCEGDTIILDLGTVINDSIEFSYGDLEEEYKSTHEYLKKVLSGCKESPVPTFELQEVTDNGGKWTVIYELVETENHRDKITANLDREYKPESTEDFNDKQERIKKEIEEGVEKKVKGKKPETIPVKSDKEIDLEIQQSKERESSSKAVSDIMERMNKLDERLDAGKIDKEMYKSQMKSLQNMLDKIQ